MAHTISICILDDLKAYYGPHHLYFTKGLHSKRKLKRKILALIRPFKKKYKEDCSEYFDDAFFEKEDEYVTNIVQSLIEKKYYVFNRYNKYYVIAFAIDFVRFEVFSKDCDKELIKWRHDDANDPIVGIISDPNYNENPVVKFIRLFNSHSN